MASSHSRAREQPSIPVAAARKPEGERARWSERNLGKGTPHVKSARGEREGDNPFYSEVLANVTRGGDIETAQLQRGRPRIECEHGSSLVYIG